MFCRIDTETQNIEEIYHSRPTRLGDAYLPSDISNAALIELGIYPIEVIGDSYDPSTQIQNGPTISVQDDKVIFTYSVTEKPIVLADVKADALIEIKMTRQQALDKIANSSGVLAIYNENYFAALNVLSGNPSVLTKNGMTSLEYMTGFGSHLGLTAAQFSQYIVNENHRVGPTAYQIEQRYLALAYAGDAANGIYPISVMTNVNDIKKAVEDYKVFCNL